MSTANLIKKKGLIVQWLIPLSLLLMLAFVIKTNFVAENNLLFTINWNYPLAFLETDYAYLYLHIFTIVPVLLLSFDKKVAFYKWWKYLFPAIFIVGAVFIVADSYFTKIGVWNFNETYFLDYRIATLPIEEWIFFLTVPYACTFIYACLNAYFPKDRLENYDKLISPLLMVAFLGIGLLNVDKLYTSTTFLSAAALVAYHYLFIKNSYRTLFYRAYLVMLIPFFIVNGVLTGGYTTSPIVVYNPEEYLGLRITSVPIDDAVYGFVLMFAIISLLEQFRSKN